MAKYSQVQFKKSVAVLCIKLHAKEIEPAYPRIGVEPVYEFDTHYGKLQVRCLDDWISCRFLEPKRAMDVLSWHSKWSGKWNFHGERSGRRETFLEFSNRLKVVLSRQTQADQQQLPFGMPVSFA